MRCLVSLALIGAAWATPGRAAEPKVVAGTPPDASLFVYAEVSKLWASSYAESLRAAGLQEVKEVLADLEKNGIKPEEVKAVSVFIPAGKPGEVSAQEVVFRAEFHRPYDRAKLLPNFARGRDAKLDAAGRYSYPGTAPLRLVRDPNNPKDPGRYEPIPWAKPVGGLVVDFSDPLVMAVFEGVSPDALKPAAAPGRMTAALQAAEASQLVMAVDRVLLAEATKGEFAGDLKPFAPLADVDALTLTGKLAADGSMPLELRAAGGDAAKTAAAGKALDAGLKVLSTIAGVTAVEPGKEQGLKDRMGGLAPLLKALAPALKAATVKADGPTAVATLTLPADLPVGPSLAALINDRPPGMRPGNRAVTQNNLKQIALAFHNYESGNGAFPPAAICDKAGKPLLSWRVAVLTYLGQEALYKQFKLDEPWDSAHNKTVVASNPMPAVYTVAGVTPAGAKTTQMQVFVGNGAAFDLATPAKLTRDFPDGTSNTILVAVAAKPVDWTKPEDMPFDPKADPRPLLSLDKDFGGLIAMADGSVRGVWSTGPAEVFKTIITRAGGEIMRFDQLDKPPAADPKPRPNPFGKGDQAEAQNNLKQIGLAMHNYESAYGKFPAPALVDKAGKPLLSWRVAVLPYLGKEAEALYKQFKLDEPWDSAHNKKVLADNPMPAVYVLPGEMRVNEKITPFQVFAGKGTMFDPALKGVRVADITDGTSNTVMVAVAATPVDWTKPADMPFDPAADPVKLLHAPVMLVMGDGSVRSPKAVTADKLRAAITAGGGETLRLDD